MKALYSFTAGLLSCFFMIPGAYAWDITASGGATGQGQATVRLGVSQQWNQQWFDSSVGHLTGYWDLAYTYWASGKNSNDEHSISISPVLVYEFKTQGAIKPFIELGIGLAGFTGTRVGDKKLGSAFNFEDRIGVGLNIYDTHRVGLRAIHYSNAGLKKPNNGIESYSLYYSMQF